MLITLMFIQYQLCCKDDSSEASTMTVFSSIVMTVLSTDGPATLSNPMSVICESSTPGSPSSYKKTFMQRLLWLISFYRFVLKYFNFYLQNKNFIL